MPNPCFFAFQYSPKIFPAQRSVFHYHLSMPRKKGIDEARQIWNIVQEQRPENRSARITVLIDPNQKFAFELSCSRKDTTASQVIRQFIRDYIRQNPLVP